MATKYSKIYGFVRSLVGDDNAEAYVYPDEALLSQVDWLIVELDDSAIAAAAPQDDEDPEFGSDLSNANLARVSVRIALNLLAPDADEFRYNSPILSVSRKGSRIGLISHLRGKLDEIEGGSLALETDNVIDAVLYGLDRYADSIDSAQPFPT